MKHLIQFSTGVASAEVAWRVTAEHGAENVVLLTADTRAEDEDNWRFGRAVADRLGCEWVILADGRTPMQVGRDRKCVPSNRMAVCSQILKRELLDAYRAEHFDPADTIVYLGYDLDRAAPRRGRTPALGAVDRRMPAHRTSAHVEAATSRLVPRAWHRATPAVRLRL